MVDSISQINRERWNALARANVEWSRPHLEYTAEQAACHVYRHGVLSDVRGRRVLCLASGGGQDSAAFGLLGAKVTAFDLSDEQLARDRQAAAHHGYPLTTIQGDMRDLNALDPASFDLVWQIYSINFSPAVEPVFTGVARVLRPGGIYFLQLANPFTMAVDEEAWDGQAYPLNAPYRDGEDLAERFPHWDVALQDGSLVVLDSPHEYRHALSTVLNGLLARGFTFLGLWEWMQHGENPEPGSWLHFTQIAPPWFDTFWRRE